ncbi:two-component system histidine kinase PnpS [Bacillus massiliigorillae]|uniref:two-component system histidine kinase PnpS n=1 Tax=Bacillus massiliigorillae TaxID=1243664 RepID=UPI0003A6BD62|nr:ATP-binding protein [Bacillus massiliigorillae]
MIKFRSKLLLATVSLIACAMFILGVFLVQLFESNHYENFKNDIQRQAILLVKYIKENGGVSDFLSNPEARASLELVDKNVTIVSKSKEIIYISKQPKEISRKQHASFIANAIKDDRKGHDELKGVVDYHYFWYPVKSKAGKVEGYVVISSELQNMKELSKQSWLLLLGALVFSLMFISVVTGKIATRFTKPIETATNTAIELAKGNFRARTYEDPNDETKMLSTSINILARNLQEMETSREMQQDRLSTLIENIGSGVLLIDSKGYITLMNKTYKQLFNVSPSQFLYRLYYEALPYQDVILLIEEIFMTEKSIKKQMFLSLQIERKHFEVYGAPIIGNTDEWKGIVLVFHDISELKKLEQMRKDFVANVSHELRTPVTSIKGFSETLLDGDLKNEKTIRDFLTIILNESDRLQTLIQELLELSKIEKSEFKIATTKLDLNNLLAETSTIFEQKAIKRGIEFHLEEAMQPVMIEGDPYRLKQIFINLISNAINYTQEGGKVDVIVSENDQFASVEVKDTGIGIEQKEIPRIFERFYRVNRDRSRNSGGTGLGLAIVKHLVEAHKGQLQVISEPGKGTSFIVKLKKRRRLS